MLAPKFTLGVGLASVVVLATSLRGSATDTSEMCAMLGLVNNFRSQNGLGALQLEQGLSAVSAALNACQASANEMSHDCGGSLQSRLDAVMTYVTIAEATENTAFDTAGDYQAAFQMFVNSPDHRQNMLGATLTHMGYASGQTFYTQDFARFSSGTPRVIDCSGSSAQPASAPPAPAASQPAAGVAAAALSASSDESSPTPPSPPAPSGQPCASKAAAVASVAAASATPTPYSSPMRATASGRRRCSS